MNPVVESLVREANAKASQEVAEFEAMQEAEAEAQRRLALERPTDAPPARPAWLEAAERLAGAPMTPEALEAQEEAAKRAELDGRRRANVQREQRYETACAALPALYSYALGDVELVRCVSRHDAIAETSMALAKSAPALVWSGLSGSGKTTLACAAARTWARRVEGKIVFARATELATASRYHALGEGQPAAIRAAISADLLILDELDQPTRTAQWSDVEDVVFARYEQNRPTWATTWLSVAQVKEAYGDGFARRLFERATIINCGGEK